MACLEKIRLQQQYDVALRRWHQVDASSQLYGQSTYLTEEVRKRLWLIATLLRLAWPCIKKTARGVVQSLTRASDNHDEGG